MNELSLIGLKREVEYLPVDVSKIPYTFSVKLQDRTYTITLKYNYEGGFFTMDLAVMATGERLCFGDPIRYGRPLFGTVEDARYPLPVIIPLCLSGEESEVTFENFGNKVQLYLYERRVE